MIDYSDIPRDSRRVPLETRVRFKFDRFSGFISEYSANISPGGMFIRTLTPQPAGTVLDLEFRLGDGFELIRGRGEVVWNRTRDEGPARPAGMGIRFLELSDGSKELIYRIVDEHILQGGTPFDVTQRPPDVTPPRPSAAGATRSTPAPAAPPSVPDIFDLPPLVAASHGGLQSASAAPSWPPSLAEPGPGPMEPAPFSEPFPELLPQAAPPELASGGGAPPAAILSAEAGGASARPFRRLLPWALAAAVLALAAGVFLLRNYWMDWSGPDGGEEVARTAPPVPTGRMPRVRPDPPPAVPEPGEANRADEGAPAGSADTAVIPAAPSAVPEPAEPVSGPALSRLERITWEQVPGGTEVILWGNGAIPPEVYARTRIGGNPPRELIRLSGVQRPYSKGREVIGTPEVLQVRVGYHPESGRGELHVVLDLAHPEVAVTGIEQGPRQLRIRLQRR